MLILSTAAGIASPAVVFSAEPGQIGHFISTSCPTGWIQANGLEFSPTLYPDLKTAVPNLCALTPPFRCYIPQLGGYFIRSFTTNQSTDSARLQNSFQYDSFQGHLHAPKTGSSFTVFNLTTGVRTFGAGVHFGQDTETGNAIANTNHGTPRTSWETRPLNFSALACIKATKDTIGGSSMSVSSFTLVEVSTTAAAQLNPGIWGYFTAGDVSFWFGVLVAGVVIMGFKAGGMR